MIEIKKKTRPDLMIWMTVVLVVLAAIHFLDVRAGVIESGDHWLAGRFLMLAGVGIAAALGIGWLLLRRECRFETVFLFTAIFFGMVNLYVLPPLSAPDEARHYISAYRLSNRLMGLPETGEDGKVIIRAEDWFAEDSCGDYQPYLTEDGMLATDEAGADGAKVLGQVLTEETYGLIHEKGVGFGMEEEKQALSNHQSVVTTPAAYLAPALGITFARILGLNSMGLLYMGRLFHLLLFVAVMYLAIRMLPFGKEVMFGVSLLPMTIHLSSSYSYDVLIISGVCFLTSYCLYLAYEAEQVRKRDVLVLAVTMAVVGPCKLVYTVFMGLCLLIPVKKFGSWKQWFLSAGCVLTAWGIAMVLVNGQTVASYATETENYIDWAGEAGYSLTLLLHQPVRTLQMIYQTIVWQAEYYHQTMIGAYLGHVDLVLDVPYVIVMFFTAGLLMLAFRKPGETQKLTGGKRIWCWILCAACTGALLLSMFLAWTPVSSKVICGVQGRYFLPFLPLVLMACKNDTIVLTKNMDRSILYLMCCADVYVLFRIFSVVCMRL